MSDPTAPKPLRLLPAVVILAVQWLIGFGIPLVAPDAEIGGQPMGLIAVLAGIAGGFAILVWWLVFSRARWYERIGAIVLMIVAVRVTKLFVHPSIAGAGQGMLMYVSTVPYLSLALVAWAAITRHTTDRTRRAALCVVAIVIACVPWTLVRISGVGGRSSEFHWRWTPTPEQLLLARQAEALKPLPSPPPAASEAAVPPAPAVTTTVPTTVPKESIAAKAAEPATASSKAGSSKTATKRVADWPGFRGRDRDGVVPGVRIQTDWTASPPVQMWRRPIGPGWSSFAVDGDVLYTQEQRGDDEMVAAYRVSSGEPVWRHRDAVRFWESNGGAGPRGTPTLGHGRVYAFGATGILNALDARTGAVIWSRNVAKDTGRNVPYWGFTSSPLIVGDEVIVAAAATLAGYDAATGAPRWRGPSYGGSYSSPHRATIDGVTQVLLVGGPGAISVAPADGKVLWTHEWSPGAIVQPAVMADGNVLINTIVATGGVGTRRLAVSQRPDGWRVEERWTSNGLKPFFNDFVVHKGHAYGFDNNILACINLDDGARRWKGGRYGNGQMILLPDQDLLLVVSDEGELALVGATTDQYKEIARVPALDAKTWNHPALVRDVLLVRNGEEMAAFRLSLEGR